MKIYTNHHHRTDELLKEASVGKPVMNLDEVEQIVNAGRYTSAVGFKGIHIGINTVIVTSGIIVSSFLAYMALKVDKQSTQSGKFKIENTVPLTAENHSPVTETKQVEPVKNNTLVVVSKNEHSGLAHSNNNLLASSNNKIIVSKNKETPTNSSQLTEPLASNIKVSAETNSSSNGASSPVSLNKKMLSGELKISFVYNDQEVEMKLIGDNVSQLSIDGRIIDREKFDDYSDMISEGENYLAGKHGKEAKNSLDLIQYFDSQLQQDKLIATDAPYTFELNSSQLLINKSAQSNEAFTKYKKLYETKTGKIVTDGSVYRFERGAKSN